MPLPYADLVVSTLNVPSEASAGRPLPITWTVTNQGIGTTNVGNWIDHVYLARDAAGTDRVADLRFDFEHFGHLAPGGSYERSGNLAIPAGLTGTYYVVVVTGGPFEFIYTDNNTRVSAAVSITLPPLPDLVVTDIVAPATAVEGTLVDISWTVANQGEAAAEGSWVDRVYLQKAGDTTAPIVELGRFGFPGPVAAGQTYTRSEAVRLPVQTNDLYRLFITSDFENNVYEGTGAEGNNTRFRTDPIAIQARPRPDLQVQEIIAPDRVPGGGSLSVEFIIINQGTASTDAPHWVDKVYLSLDTTIDQNDILIGQIGNQAALAPGEQYTSSAGPIVVPIRFRGDVYVIVQTDAGGAVEEWPNEGNNILRKTVYVEPQPLADLVVSNVVAPDQAVAGTQVEVRYTVTNLGSGPTYEDTWTETVWLTRDRVRPNPAHGDILLKTLTHTGALERNAGYDVTTSVRIPRELDSGTWYITPWVDPYDVVPEDTLAVNNNPDDPNQIDNNNYKARVITIIGARPDLVVTDIVAPAAAVGGTMFTVSWTVQNRGTAAAEPGGWGDRVFLSDRPDPKDRDAHALYLGQVKHEGPLAIDETYTASLTVQLSPSAVGQYIVVIADDARSDSPGISLPGLLPPPPPSEQFTPVTESNEDNNARAEVIDVTPVPANLLVTNIEVPEVNYSGESITFRYTVTNVGAYEVWADTRSWRDFLWLSADPTFIRERASYLGETRHIQQTPLQPGASYEVTFTTKLPEGTGGLYYLYIDLDAHNDLSPILFPYQARLLLTDWWPADKGSNADWVEHFHTWAFEDPRDNRARADVPIIYREADLRVTDLEIPDSASSGESIPVTFTVTNVGTRATRVSGWTDRFFISHDASLDNLDHLLLDVGRAGVLEPGASYTQTVNVRLPDDIEGTFHLLAYADSAAFQDPLRRLSDIGFNLIRIEFERPSPLAPWDLASAATRELARGRVKEFQGEGDNITGAALLVTLAPTPDLQVTTLTAPTHAFVGQPIEVTY